MARSKRFLGLELSGAKNHKTSLAALEFFPEEKKVFLLDIFDRIAAREDQSGDEALLEMIEEVEERVVSMGVNVPLVLPPCLNCTPRVCPTGKGCRHPSVKWMHQFSRRVSRSVARVREFTPYTQRPVELWVRYRVLPRLPEMTRFEVDETMGGNRAPLAARMHYLKRRITGFPLVEIWPKLSIAILAENWGIPRRWVSTYRDLELGAHSREEIAHQISEKTGIFVYERDFRKLSQSLTAFDAFICALTAFMADQDQCTEVPAGFPHSSGWIQFPCLPTRSAAS